MKKKHTFIDLFSGCGGLSLGFEMDEQARRTYYANYGDVPFWRSNAAQPNLNTLNKVAKLLEVEMKDLLNELE